MDTASRISAVIAYVPVIGWLYGLLLMRRNAFVHFHAKQSLGLFLFLALIFAAWMVVGWLLAWLPYGFLMGVVLFALVVAAAIFGVIVLIIGLSNALRGRIALLPVFGRRANQLPL